MLSSAGGPSLALHADGRKSSDDRPSCLENPRPEGAEPTLTENVASPFQAEPRQSEIVNLRSTKWNIADGSPTGGVNECNRLCSTVRGGALGFESARSQLDYAERRATRATRAL